MLSHFQKWGIWGITLLTLSACGLFSKNDAGGKSNLCSSPQTTDDLNAFKSTLMPSLQMNCAQCHNSLNPQAPAVFADDSPSVALPDALRYANLSAPENSIFVQKMNQQHNCSTAGCATLAELFTSQIAAWAEQQTQSSDSGDDSRTCSDPNDAQIIRTTAQDVPSSLGSETLTLKFDLSVASPSVPGGVFQVSVKRFTSPSGSDYGSYQILNPMLAVQPFSADNTVNARITSVALLLDGQINPSFRDWLSTDFIVKPRIFSPSLPLSGWYIVNPSPQIVEWGTADTDSIAFSFRFSRTSSYPTQPDFNPFTCRSVSRFRTFFNAKSAECLSCHGNVASMAYATFPMSPTDDATNCENFKQRADLSDYTQSLFYLMPQNLIPDRMHPVTISFSSTDQQNIQNWLDNEQ